MTSGPHIDILAASNTLIGDPPLRSLRFARLLDDIDGAEPRRQRVRVAVRLAPTLRYGRMSRVVFLIPARDDAEPYRVEADSPVVQPSEVRSVGRTIRSIPRPRTACDERSES
jgi:hypothetical protein